MVEINKFFEKRYLNIMQPNDDSIAWAIRLFLGREPNSNEIDIHRSHKNLDSLRKGFIGTEEFKVIFNRWANNENKDKYLVPSFLLPTRQAADFFSGVEAVFYPPSLDHITCQLCTAEQFNEPIYIKWCSEMGMEPHLQRKQWEFVWILAAMDKCGVLKPGMRALGFGTGTEPIPSVLANHGLYVTASDAPPDNEAVQGWSQTNQHSKNVSDLYKPDIIEWAAFDEKVTWLPIDMNHIPGELINFDVCWSACAFEHLGSLEQGLLFVENSLQTLRPGGYAIHTTEFNLSSNTKTLESDDLSIFRKCDIEKLANVLTSKGHKVWPLNFFPGNGEIDEIIDLPPYSTPHIKLNLKNFCCTSIGLMVQKSEK